MTTLTAENLAELRRALDDMRDLATREGIYNGNRAVLDIIGRVEPLLDAAARPGEAVAEAVPERRESPGVAELRRRLDALPGFALRHLHGGPGLEPYIALADEGGMPLSESGFDAVLLFAETAALEVPRLLDRLAHGQQHAGHPAGGTWCGVTNDPGVADVRPRVPVCADCHIKAMRHRADLLDSTEAALAHMTEARDNDPATASASTATVPEPLIPTHGRTTS